MSRVLLIGMGPTGLSALDSLTPLFEVVGVVRNDEDSAADLVFRRARDLNVAVFTDTSSSRVAELVNETKPDCVVVSSYNRILKSELIERCPFVNVHYAPLPQYRGRANVNWGLINDESSAGITIHKLTPDLDAGNILYQQLIPVEERDTVTDLYRKLNIIQQQYLGVTVLRYLDGYDGTPQDPSRATYGCTRIPVDGEIDWKASTRQIDCLVRALTAPYPGAYTHFQGERLVIWKAEPVKDPPFYVGRVPGRVISVSPSAGYVDVLTGDGVLRLIEVQLSGQPCNVAARVIRSVRETLGLRIVDLLEKVEQIEKRLTKLMEQQPR